MRRRGYVWAMVCALAAALAVPAGAAAKRSVPFGFFGTQFSGGTLLRASAARQDAEVARMARSGVESMRVQFSWEAAQPVPGPASFAATDPVMAYAARHRLSVLPIVLGAPRWASTRPGSGNYQVFPKTGPFTSYLTAAVRRYGPKGSFWKANPRLPRSPVRAWQIWNEPGFRFFYGPANYRTTYPKLLKASYRAIKQADPGAKVVIAGLANTFSGGKDARIWTDLAAFYKHGAKRYFDVLAIHPFGATMESSMESIRRTRAVMRRNHDSGTPIWFTEFFFTASKGKVPKRRELGLEVTAKAQRRLLRTAYVRFATDRSLGVKRVFWHPWATQYRPVSDNGAEPSFEYSGLVKYTRPGFSPTRLLGLYTSLARRYEGCRKTSNARRCR